MENKIEEMRETRKSIIAENSSKEIARTKMDDYSHQDKEILEVVVKDITQEAPDVKSFVFAPDKDRGTLSFPSFRAGSYVSLKVMVDGTPTSRAYSISSSPKDASNGIIRITIKRVENGLVSNYMLDQINVGDKLEISKPMGSFGYNAITDEKNVIGIAGGSGITPFMSIAKAIVDGEYDCDLTVFYSVKTYEEIIFKKEIEEINKHAKNVKFIITLTREEKEGYLHGHLSKEMIEPYIKEFNTVLMCGPKAIYKAMNDILFEFDIPRKNVRYENFFSDFEPNEIKDFNLRVISKGEVKVVPCHSNETLLVSMEKAGINAPSLCRVGECGFCTSVLIEGKIKMVGAQQPKALQENDYIHPCVTYPESDIVLKIDI